MQKKCLLSSFSSGDNFLKYLIFQNALNSFLDLIGF
jgi:hypothetical protein